MQLAKSHTMPTAVSLHCNNKCPELCHLPTYTPTPMHTPTGGPSAHIGLFQKRIVEKLRWMSDGVYMELFALSSCLPGPTSTQVSFAIGTVRKGVLGGLLSGALFQYPGAIIMTAVGVGAAETLDVGGGGAPDRGCD